MGGDRGHAAVVAGALEAAAPGIEPILFGDRGIDARGLRHVETNGEIGMDEKPADAVRAKPDSSLVSACRAVGEGEADAVVSAGNTGAMLAACFLELRRLPGGARPAIAGGVPAKNGATGVIRSGANTGARPRRPGQFAPNGSVL